MRNTLIVIDDNTELNFPDHQVLSFSRYLAEYPVKNEGRTNIINLCDTTHYLSKGYYCSLLAEARKHKVLPTINTINDLRNQKYNLLQLPETIFDDLPDSVEPENTAIKFTFYFGTCTELKFQKLASKLFSLFPTPILEVTLKWKTTWVISKIVRGDLKKLKGSDQQSFVDALRLFIASTWPQKTKIQKNMRWDMAILVDPNQTVPPSDKYAISRFIKAAAKVNIAARCITQQDYLRLPEFDALFIRETTAIDHFTYRFARKAELENMVVIDDPTSILRCCNKVFLHDAFTYNDVPSLKTIIVTGYNDTDIEKIEKIFSYPCVIKLPESAFSKGVFKVKSRTELITILTELLATTSLVLVQEYFYTEYDWRIGVLNGHAIYACKYHMAKNHWQVINYRSKRHHDGVCEAFPIFEIPKSVLDAAIKACKIIGNGLYGVDIKENGKKAYVIEVNDNPSIEYQVEDLYLGNELYMIIMTEFARRLEIRGR